MVYLQKRFHLTCPASCHSGLLSAESKLIFLLNYQVAHATTSCWLLYVVHPIINVFKAVIHWTYPVSCFQEQNLA